MGSGALLMVVAFFPTSVLHLLFLLVSEMPSSRPRTKTIILARNRLQCDPSCSYSFDHVPIEPREMELGVLNQAFSGGGFVWPLLAWAVVDLPETAGRTFC
ncbi:AKR_collapsed_G0026000.mRNA.1.CDS.1 [Saccharomyces cerevisiae]|nr:AKR_collapsed_G0026000.mRNA.1.CDS.1 [Saccharomyces cerevisiae]